MKFGIIPGYQIAPVETAEYATGFGRLAEELGFESLWPVEHVVMPAHYESRYPYAKSGRMPIPEAPIPDPLTWNTWVAATTSRIALGTAMLILPQRNPVVLAKTVASLDVLSGGRVILGVGLGWMREEAEAVGTNFGDRGRRADEYIEAMRALWTQKVASFRGRNRALRSGEVQPAADAAASPSTSAATVRRRRGARGAWGTASCRWGEVRRISRGCARSSRSPRGKPAATRARSRSPASELRISNPRRPPPTPESSA